MIISGETTNFNQFGLAPAPNLTRIMTTGLYISSPERTGPLHHPQGRWHYIWNLKWRSERLQWWGMYRKSSLAWAIAGVFGLDIFCFSLVDPTLTEEDLGMMFTSLPRRCVILLEDIDAAGLNKRQEDEKAQEMKDEDPAAKMGAEITKAFKSVQKNDKDKQGITLSGLLNAIDGVASHEGRVLVMTTNFPDKLSCFKVLQTLFV